ncbi:MAG: hypothetical protein GT601_05995 [Acidaminobacter sp.]|uniref:portal protein n=1 Tax=Acidaminobacter sp. TaxID=1872102 RepID=UPI00137D3BAA|nr:hypothetical protein [Acidaminobacter sp.]MZQ97207.1 hypothetical protein [Acidaminobacter sp.]
MGFLDKIFSDKEENDQEPMDKALIRESVKQLEQYRKGSEALQSRRVENEEWYKSRHWDYIRNTNHEDDPEPTSHHLLNTIMQKHASAMDFYPSANILPREPDDIKEAERLSKIIPVELEYNDFRDIWDQHWWEKLKHGCGILGVVYDPDGQDGIGSGKIVSIDGNNIYHQPGINDIQESASVYVTKLVDNEMLKMEYPDVDLSESNKLFEPKKYLTDDSWDSNGMSLVIDRYYKKPNAEGKIVIHYLKFVGENLLYASANDPEYADVGFYDHGDYPFVFDTLFPEKNNIRGFGLIDIGKNPQIYIDKIDQMIIRNALTTGRKRFFVSKSSSIDKEQFADLTNDIIDVTGNPGEEMIREMVQNPMPAYIQNHRVQKIEEFKDNTNTNEASRGETSKGVTAASAIIALQQAAGKFDRSIIAKTYSKFSQVIYLYVEVVRQFYDIERSYRIGEQEEMEFVKFDNSGLVQQQMAGDFEEPKYRKPVFDIKVVPEKRDPFSQAAHNEMAKEMFQMGVFNPQRAIEARVMLDMMQFEGIDEIKRMVKENDQIMQMLQQVMAQVQTLQQENGMLKTIVQNDRGVDLGIPMGANNGQGANLQR